MATAKKLPSGNWRVRVGAGEAGKTKSFTAPTKKEAEIMAAEYLRNARKPQIEKTIGECIDDYIELKANILSPTTISGYRNLKRNCLEPICCVRLCDLDTETAQAFVNRLSAEKSPKTVHNAFGLLSSIVSTYRPEMAIRVTLPAKKKRFVVFPEITDIIRAAKGTQIELPVLLALWMGMRMSEIRGARKSDIHDGVLTIQSVIVDVDGVITEKDIPKTYTSARQLPLPEYILTLIDSLPEDQDHLTQLSGQAIYKRFSRLLESNNLPHIRFHDLRHLNASVMASLGIPEKYAMERGGWSTPAIMRDTYQHTFSGKRLEVESQLNDYFSSIV